MEYDIAPTGYAERRRNARGMTLLELVIAIALLALLTAVAVQSPLAVARREPSLQASIDSLRRRAMSEGHAEHAIFRDSVRSGEVTALPTGLVVADPTLGFGRPRDEASR